MYNFGVGTLFAVPTADATGAAIANGTPVQFGTVQDISGDISFEEKLLYGQNQFPVAVARGKGKIQFKAKSAGIFGSILGDLLLGTGSSAGIKRVYPNFPAAVPGVSAYTITIAPPSSGTFSNDLGVINASTGKPMTKVASAPSAGQYSVSNLGVYTFAAADANLAVLISYEYTATSTSAKYGNITNQLMGYTPSFKMALSTSYQGKNFGLVLNQVSSAKLSLPFKNDDFTIPEFEMSAYSDAAGNVGYWYADE